MTVFGLARATLLAAAVAAPAAGCSAPSGIGSSTAGLGAGSALETWNHVTAYVYGGHCANVYARSGTDAGYRDSDGSVLTDTCGFQCVELAVRYFNFNEGIPVSGWHVGAAVDMCANHPAGVDVVSTPVVGDLMIYRPNDPYYGTGWAGHVAVIRGVNADGTLDVFNQNWGNETTAFIDHIQPSHAVCFLHSRNNHPAGGTFVLHQGDRRTSSDGRFTLTMQSDGNLVLYGQLTAYSPRRALWASGTDGKGGYVADMQGDGNFVVYDAAHAPLWASNTAGHAGAYLVVQNDGNTVIYAADGAPLWATATVQPAPPRCSPTEVYDSAYDGHVFWTCDLDGDGGRFICDANGYKTTDACAGGCIAGGLGANDVCAGDGTCTGDEQYASAYDGSFFWTCDLNGGASRFICDANGRKTTETCATYCIGEGTGQNDICNPA